MIHIVQQNMYDLEPNTLTGQNEMGSWKKRLFAFGFFKEHQRMAVLFERWYVPLVVREEI